MQIRKIDTRNRDDARQFIDLPYRLYRKSPYWVPPLRSEMELVLDRDKHPFYQHSEADFFVAESEGQVVGRIAALHNRNYCAHHHEQTGFLYYFDAADDQQAANGLFDAAVGWGRERGLDLLLAGKGIIRSNGAGLLVEGFDDPYMPIGILYNYPYYQTLFDSYGFTKENDHLSGMLLKSADIGERVHGIAERVLEQGGFSIMACKTKKEMYPWIPRVEKVHHEAFHTNAGYYPTTPAEFELLARGFISLADPALIKLVMKGDEIAGFAMTFPNIAPALRAIRGRLWPLGWILVMRAQKTSKVIDGSAIGLLPQYQGRGANALLYNEIEKTLRARNVERVNIIQVDERNARSKADHETMGVKFHLRHRTYRLPIG